MISETHQITNLTPKGSSTLCIGRGKLGRVHTEKGLPVASMECLFLVEC
jgi:hypothetical protein